MIRLTLLTRPGCQLCDAMKGTIQRMADRHHQAVVLEEVDISSDTALERRFGHEIPVLMHGDLVVARTRTTEDEILTHVQRAGTG